MARMRSYMVEWVLQMPWGAVACLLADLLSFFLYGLKIRLSNWAVYYFPVPQKSSRDLQVRRERH
jgi:hypothetical protein